MQHRYSSESRMGGLWFTPGAMADVFCSWWWDGTKTTLYVRRGKSTRTWSPSNLNPLVLRRVLIDLPEIARGMGRQMEEESDTEAPVGLNV